MGVVNDSMGRRKARAIPTDKEETKKGKTDAAPLPSLPLSLSRNRIENHYFRQAAQVQLLTSLYCDNL